MTKHLLIAALLSIGLTAAACSDDDPTAPVLTTPTRPEELTAALEAVSAGSNLAGFAVAVVRNGSVVYQAGFGHADIAAGRPYSPETTQPVGSVSKTILGVALMKAVELGYFDLDTEVDAILPFQVRNPAYPDRPIRIEHLVTHTSGLVDDEAVYFSHYTILPGEDAWSELAQVLRGELGFSTGVPMALGEYLSAYYVPGGELYSATNFGPHAPGKAWAYSNIAASLAAYVVEVASGRPFAEFVDEEVFQPLGLSDTAYGDDSLDPARRAVLYYDLDTPFPRYGNASYPDGSINTSAADLAVFLIDVMQGYAGQSTRLLSSSGYRRLIDPITVDEDLGPTPHGVFWMHEADGRVGHTGGDPGVEAYLSFDPVGGTGSLVMLNREVESADGSTQLRADVERILALVRAFEGAG